MNDEQTPYTEAETAENYLSLMDDGRLPLTACVTIINQLKKGSYRLKARTSHDLNEITLELWESSIRQRPVATAYIDRGHTRDDRKSAAKELAGTARAFLRIENVTL